MSMTWLAALAALTTPVHAEEARPLTRSIANEVTLYSMMASNAYADDLEKTSFALDRLGWKKVDLQGQPVPGSRNSYRPKTFAGDVFSNLQFDIWEDSNSRRTVFAFKGTKEKIDWFTGNLMLGISIPYKSAKKHVREYMTAHPDRTVTVTGHSLGGGLALSVSFWEGVDAVVFNTSPRIFDGLKNQNKPATRLAVFQEDDILQKVRRWYPKFLASIKPEQIVETRFDYVNRNTHRSDLLAEGLLACSTDPALKELASETKLTVACYLESAAPVR
jgi:hypothetical protein